MGHPCCRPGFRGQVCQLYEHLLRNADRYFDRFDTLNSDGRRLLEVIARMLLEDAPWLEEAVKRVRREPSLERVLRLGSYFYECSVYELLAGRLGLTPYL